MDQQEAFLHSGTKLLPSGGWTSPKVFLLYIQSGEERRDSTSTFQKREPRSDTHDFHCYTSNFQPDLEIANFSATDGLFLGFSLLSNDQMNVF